MPATVTRSDDMLIRGLGPVAATSIVIGVVIGTGVFLKARVMTCNVGSPWLVVTVWVAAAVIYTARVPGALAWFGLLPVVPMTIMSCALMVIVSLATTPPSSRTLARYGW